jgi:hypothetical protein
MSFARVIVIASIFMGVSTALAQQPATKPKPPPPLPLFQGIMVDAKGKTVGRLGLLGRDGVNTVILQLSGTWVEVLVDPLTGFISSPPLYFYQTADCTLQVYLSFTLPGAGRMVLPAVAAAVAAIPPATEPSIYFAGTPTLMTPQSFKQLSDPSGCHVYNGEYGASLYVGLPQSVPVSSLGLTLPFSVE